MCLRSEIKSLREAVGGRPKLGLWDGAGLYSGGLERAVGFTAFMWIFRGFRVESFLNLA